jgi:hypothetical protein
MKAIGVDIGTAFIAGARYQKNNIQAIYIRDGFFKMPWSQQRETMLKRSGKGNRGVPFIVKDRPNVPGKRDIFVIGNEAFDMAVLFGQPLRRPLKDGIISAAERETEFILKEIIRRAAGQGEPGDIAYYSVPANPIDRPDINNIYHTEMFRRFLMEAGYKPTPLNEGMAVAYSELADHDFTGLSASLGAGLVNCSLAYKGMEVFSFAINKSGDFIDEQVAKSRGIPVSDATSVKESWDDPTTGHKGLDLCNPQDDVEEAIVIFYKHTLEYVLSNLALHLEEHKRKIKLKDPLPFVVAGGTTKPRGFLKLFAQALKENPLPIPIGKVWQAKDAVMAVCKGCLTAAQAELSDDGYDGVHDVSGGENKKHQYPTKPKEVAEAKTSETPKEKRDNRTKSEVLQQANEGFADAIDLQEL